MGRKQARRNSITGLKKRCGHLDWNRCECPWYGSFRTVEKKNLNRWARRDIRNRVVAEVVFADFKKAILDGHYNPAGQCVTTDGSGMLFKAFLDIYRREEVGAEFEKSTWRLTGRRHHSTSILPMIGVLESEFGSERLQALAEMDPLLWKQRLDRLQTVRGFKDRTWNRYFQLGSALFSWARTVRRLGIRTNPFGSDHVFYMKREAESSRREVRIPFEKEQAMIQVCLSGALDSRVTRAKLTPASVSEIRGRVAAGESQRSIAASIGISPATVSEVVTGKTWSHNEPEPSDRSRQMLRRLYAAIDCGLRAGEMLSIRLRDLEFGVRLTMTGGEIVEAVRITLPAANTKAGKTSGQDATVWAVTPRLISALEERRFIGPDGFVFGMPSGARQCSFEWARLFELVGLTPGRDGYQWHDLRHEFASYLIEQGASQDDVRRLARHRDFRTTEKYITRQEQTLAQKAALMTRRGSG